VQKAGQSQTNLGLPRSQSGEDARGTAGRRFGRGGGRPEPRPIRWSASSAPLTKSPSARPLSCWIRSTAPGGALFHRGSARKSSPSRLMSTWTMVCCWRPSGFIKPPWPLTPRRRGPRRAGRDSRAHRRRQGRPQEAVTSLELLPSVDAYLVLVRLDLAANHLDEAKQNVEAALQNRPSEQDGAGTSAADCGQGRAEEVIGFPPFPHRTRFERMGSGICSCLVHNLFKRIIFRSMAGDCWNSGYTLKGFIMATRKAGKGPQFVRFFGPLLDALRKLGGSGTPEEAVDQIAKDLGITDAEQDERLTSGESRFKNQVAWARFYLVRDGLLDSSKRGVWSLTDKGQTATLTHEQAKEIFLRMAKIFRVQRGQRHIGKNQRLSK
jgi:hypothetical protein